MRKKFIIGSLLFLIAASSFCQVTISTLPTATGKAAGGWLPVVVSGVNQKVKVDSVVAIAKEYADDLSAGDRDYSDLLFDLNVADAAAKLDTAKTYTDSVVAAMTSGEVVTVKVTLSSSDLLAAGTTAKTLIAAPGAGKIIRPLGFTFRLNYGTTTYTGGVLRIYYSSGGSYLVSNSSYTNASSIIFYGAINSTVALTPSAANDSLILDAASAVSVGDGTLDVYITYSEITL